jgi:hypothetical protein
MNQNYRVNGRDLNVQIDPDSGTGLVWLQRKPSPLPVWYRFEIQLVKARWILDPDSSSNEDNPPGLSELVESFLSVNSANLCDGKY